MVSGNYSQYSAPTSIVIVHTLNYPRIERPASRGMLRQYGESKRTSARDNHALLLVAVVIKRGDLGKVLLAQRVEACRGGGDV